MFQLVNSRKEKSFGLCPNSLPTLYMVHFPFCSAVWIYNSKIICTGNFPEVFANNFWVKGMTCLLCDGGAGVVPTVWVDLVCALKGGQNVCFCIWEEDRSSREGLASFPLGKSGKNNLMAAEAVWGGRCYQRPGRRMCPSLSCWRVSGSGALHTFARVHESTSAHITCWYVHSYCKHPSRAPPHPSPTVWTWEIWQKGRGTKTGRLSASLWKCICRCQNGDVRAAGIWGG